MEQDKWDVKQVVTDYMDDCCLMEDPGKYLTQDADNVWDGISVIGWDNVGLSLKLLYGLNNQNNVYYKSYYKTLLLSWPENQGILFFLYF